MLRAWHEYRYGEIREDDDWRNDPIKPSASFKEAFEAGRASMREEFIEWLDHQLCDGYLSLDIISYDQLMKLLPK